MSNNIILRCAPDEWVAIAQRLPDGCADTVAYFTEGTLNDLTGETVPEGMIHVALVDIHPAVHQVLTDTLRDMGWGVSSDTN